MEYLQGVVSGLSGSKGAPKPAVSDESKRGTLYAFESSFPRTYLLLKEGKPSPLIKFIENAFAFLKNIQYYSLPLQYRDLCVKQYIKMETARQWEVMEAKFLKCKEKEDTYFEDEGYQFEDLTEDDQKVVQAMRNVIFKEIYAEQKEFEVKESEISAFISIWDGQGEQNTLYAAQVIAARKAYVSNGKDSPVDSPDKIDKQVLERAEKIFKQCMQKKNVELQELSQPRLLLVNATKASAYQTFLQILCEELASILSVDRFLLFCRLTHHFEKGQDVSFWEEIKKIQEEARAQTLAKRKWEYYFQKEKQAFGKEYGYDFASLSSSQLKLIAAIKRVVFRVINEEQGEYHPSLSFVSIYDENGEMNASYWIDLLKAKAKLNKEKSPDEPHFNEYSDYDAICTANGNPQGKGVQDPKRVSGAVIRPFCQKVLEEMSKTQKELLKRISGTSLDALFLTEALSREEQVMCFQNQFCEALTNLYDLMGKCKKLLSSFQIEYLPQGPQLEFFRTEQIEEGFIEFTKLLEAFKSEDDSLKPRLPLPSQESQLPEDFLLALPLIPPQIQLYSAELMNLGKILDLFSKGLIESIRKTSGSSPLSPTGRRSRNVSMDFALPVASLKKRFPSQGSNPELPKAELEKEEKKEEKEEAPQISNTATSQRVRAASVDPHVFSLGKQRPSSQGSPFTLSKAKQEKPKPQEEKSKPPSPEKEVDPTPDLSQSPPLRPQIPILRKPSFTKSVRGHVKVPSQDSHTSSPRGSSPRSKGELIASPRLTDSPRVAELSPNKLAIASQICFKIANLLNQVEQYIAKELPKD